MRWYNRIVTNINYIRSTMNSFSKLSVATVMALAPMLALAETVGGWVNTVNTLIGAVTPIVVALALIYFFWSLAMFITESDDKDKRKKAISGMIFGIIALFVMVSIWGIVGVLQGTFGVAGTTTVQPPSVTGIH